ncbi:fimbrial protein [Shewanella gaetbuli]|uniref:Fimbrial protein n=1 Tax=Shewanella gaetbuli TaxID=220752 RepID=A0A9X1ZKS5_9GAMM|nr:hypothetical protein [Shewanella gaetbuli]MCL1141630.1 hypothetical protein [Shewanella gaetbuli]
MNAKFLVLTLFGLLVAVGKFTKALALCIFLSLVSFSATTAKESSAETKIKIKGVIVTSGCSFSFLTQSNNVDTIDFGDYNVSNDRGIKEQIFHIQGREKGSAELGCSAFLAAQEKVSISFGDSSGRQLDQRGVVTYGAGNNIRVEINSTDLEASNNNPITLSNNEIKYDKDFASKGNFSFIAKPLGLKQAEPGEYNGSLSIYIKYN